MTVVAVVLVAVEHARGDLGSWLMPETGREEPVTREQRAQHQARRCRACRTGGGRPACGEQGRARLPRRGRVKQGRARSVERGGPPPGVPLCSTPREPQGPGPRARCSRKKKEKEGQRKGAPEQGPPGGQAGPPACVLQTRPASTRDERWRWPPPPRRQGCTLAGRREDRIIQASRLEPSPVAAVALGDPKPLRDKRACTERGSLQVTSGQRTRRPAEAPRQSSRAQRPPDTWRRVPRRLPRGGRVQACPRWPRS